MDAGEVIQTASTCLNMLERQRVVVVQVRQMGFQHVVGGQEGVVRL